MKPIIVSYCTPDSQSEADADHLKRSIEHFGWPCDIESIEADSTNADAAFPKAEFCLRMLDKHSGPILYLDANCWLNQTPEWFASTATGDLSLHILLPDQTNPSDMTHRYKYHALRRGGIWNSSVMLLRNTPQVKALITDWVAWCRRRPSEWESINLQRAYHDSLAKINICPLPIAYHAGNQFIGQDSGSRIHWRDKQVFPKRDILLLGESSDASAWWNEHGQSYIDAGYSICALNNAWHAIPISHLDYWFFTDDFDDSQPPAHIPRNQMHGPTLIPSPSWQTQPYWETSLRLPLIDTCYHLLNEAIHDRVDINIHLVGLDPPDSCQNSSKIFTRLNAAFQAENAIIVLKTSSVTLGSPI